MFTASHNPAQYNGIKLCLRRRGAGRAGHRPRAGPRPSAERFLDDGVPEQGDRGTVTQQDLLADYAAYLKGLVTGLAASGRCKVVVDAGNGMGGHTVPVSFAGLPLDVVAMYFELDGSSRTTRPTRSTRRTSRTCRRGCSRGRRPRAGLRRRRRPLLRRRRARRDRVALHPHRAGRGPRAGQASRAPPSSTTSSPPGRCPRWSTEHGGTPVRTRVGHSFIKAEMAETGAVFGGEHSGHFYFRDFWGADSGMLAALHALAALGGQDRPLSELLAPYSRYAACGEINSTVADSAAKVAELEARYAGAALDRARRADGRPGRRRLVQRARLQHRAAAAAQRRGAATSRRWSGSATRSSRSSGPEPRRAPGPG